MRDIDGVQGQEPLPEEDRQLEIVHEHELPKHEEFIPFFNYVPPVQKRPEGTC